MTDETKLPENFEEEEIDVEEANEAIETISGLIEKFACKPLKDFLEFTCVEISEWLEDETDDFYEEDSGEATTRTFLRDQGPRGERDEVLSGRWLGTPPTTAHKVIIEYTEES